MEHINSDPTLLLNQTDSIGSIGPVRDAYVPFMPITSAEPAKIQYTSPLSELADLLKSLPAGSKLTIEIGGKAE